MKFEDIQEEWQKDSEINRLQLGDESLKIAKLHSKYYNIYIQEVMRLRKEEGKLKILRLDKYEFYTQGPTEETRDRGWRLPPQGRILKAEVMQYIDADLDVINQTMKISFQKEKCEFLQSIIKSLHSRGFNIKTAVDFEKFKNGVG